MALEVDFLAKCLLFCQILLHEQWEMATTRHDAIATGIWSWRNNGYVHACIFSRPKWRCGAGRGRDRRRSQSSRSLGLVTRKADEDRIHGEHQQQPRRRRSDEEVKNLADDVARPVHDVRSVEQLERLMQFLTSTLLAPILSYKA